MSLNLEENLIIAQKKKKKSQNVSQKYTNYYKIYNFKHQNELTETCG